MALIDDFQPVLGNSFEILTTEFGNDGGQFQTVLAPIVGGRTFDVIYNPKSVVLQVVEATTLPGDFNDDGVVDAADYTVWRDGLGIVYQQTDYDDWKNNFTPGGYRIASHSSWSG